MITTSNIIYGIDYLASHNNQTGIGIMDIVSARLTRCTARYWAGRAFNAACAALGDYAYCHDALYEDIASGSTVIVWIPPMV